MGAGCLSELPLISKRINHLFIIYVFETLTPPENGVLGKWLAKACSFPKSRSPSLLKPPSILKLGTDKT